MTSWSDIVQRMLKGDTAVTWGGHFRVVMSDVGGWYWVSLGGDIVGRWCGMTLG